MRDWLQRVWYQDRVPPLVLRALAAVYGAAAHAAAQRRRARRRRLPVPVVVVGNIGVGGTGKTPCVLWLVRTLHGLGYRPGVLSRGYGGSGPFPREVSADDDPGLCGDEPMLIKARAEVPVVVAPDRYAAGRALLARHPEVNVLVCDDGLQHYQLDRDIELCVIDGRRGYGNGRLLPAGPLREPVARAGGADLILVNGGDPRPFGGNAVAFDLHAEQAVALDGTRRRPLADFARTAVHAVAGIGHPARFFDSLRAFGIDVIEHPFPDHHRFAAADLEYGDQADVLMTEKDAVKCRAFAQSRMWCVPVEVVAQDAVQARLAQLLRERLSQR